MKLSEALLAGAAILGTRGPRIGSDCWDALAAGVYGHIAEPWAVNELYWSNPWGVQPHSDLEMWLRLVETHRMTWDEIATKLEGHGA